MTTRGGGHAKPSFPGRGGMGRAGRIHTVKNHAIPRTDHAGNPALVVFQGRKSRPLLPPLYSFSVYFTHGSASPATVDTDALAGVIWGIGPASFRLELFFVPGGSRDECIAHHHAEKRLRGDYMPQVEAAGALPSDDEGGESLVEGDGAESNVMPGLVPSYRDQDTIAYHGVLYAIEGPECPVADQKARRVLFDPVTQAEWDAVMRFYGEPEQTVEPVWEAEAETLEDIGSRMRLESRFRTENVTNGAWQKALNRGWTLW